jgi:hypothetical protein
MSAYRSERVEGRLYPALVFIEKPQILILEVAPPNLVIELLI